MDDTKTLVGQTIADTYLVEKELGAGGMGTVLVAKNVRLGKRYALKILNPEMSNYPGAVERFEREARAAARLGHVGICQVHDVRKDDDGLLYMVMDLLDGEDLESRMRDTGLLPWEAIYRIVSQVCDALAAAHEAGIVHRDLKPANIFLARRKGEGERAVLLDFGVAKMLDAARSLGGDTRASPVGPTPTLTTPGTIVGTPNYMSPEQASAQAVDHRSDIYSMGAVLFHMATGAPPFDAETLLAVLTMIAVDPVPKIRDVNPAAQRPPGVDEVIEKAMAKDPVDRFQDVRQLAAALPPPHQAVGLDLGVHLGGEREPASGAFLQPRKGGETKRTSVEVPAKRAAEVEAKAIPGTSLEHPIGAASIEARPPKRGLPLAAIVLGGLLFLGVAVGAVAALIPRGDGGGGGEGGGGTPVEPPPDDGTPGPTLDQVQEAMKTQNWSRASNLLAALADKSPSDAIIKNLQAQVEMEQESAILHRRAKAEAVADWEAALQICGQIAPRSSYREEEPCKSLFAKTKEAPAAGDAGPEKADGGTKVVETKGEGGGRRLRTDADVQRIVRQRRGGAVRCFDRAFGDMHPSGRVTVSVEISISASGHVTRAKMISAGYGSNTILRNCIESAVRDWQFPPGRGTDTTQFNVTKVYPDLLGGEL